MESIFSRLGIRSYYDIRKIPISEIGVQKRNAYLNRIQIASERYIEPPFYRLLNDFY